MRPITTDGALNTVTKNPLIPRTMSGRPEEKPGNSEKQKLRCSTGAGAGYVIFYIVFLFFITFSFSPRIFARHIGKTGERLAPELQTER